MEWWQQLTLALVTLFGGGTLGVLGSHYFTRRRTDAEAQVQLATAHKTDSEVERGDAEFFYTEIRKAIAQWADCVKAKTEAEVRAAEAEKRYREAEAERVRLDGLAEGYRLQLATLQERETELLARLREGSKK